MSLPTPDADAQSPRFQPRPPYAIPPIPSRPSTPLPASVPPATPDSLPSPFPAPAMESSEELEHDRVIDFAFHSWDLATGGLKTLTAKRELPSLIDQHPSGMPAEAQSLPRTYIFLLIIVVCLLLMLVSGGIVLFIILQS